LPGGQPIWPCISSGDSIGWFAGRILDQFDVGDHLGFLLEPVAGHAPERFDELVTFSDVRDVEAGHEA
jgi:flavin reductase (DIM6/NTAB) family NADH-FMN oxidoreductase RutF